MGARVQITVVSLPDRENLVAEIDIDGEQFAEVNQESEETTVEIYPRLSGGPWTMEFETLSRALQQAKTRLDLLDRVAAPAPGD